MDVTHNVYSLKHSFVNTYCCCNIQFLCDSRAFYKYVFYTFLSACTMFFAGEELVFVNNSYKIQSSNR